MNSTERFVLSLIKSAIDGSIATLPKDVDWDYFWHISKHFQLTSLLCGGINNSQIELPDALEGKMNRVALDCLMYDQCQMYVFSEIMGLFDKNGIDYMPVKGLLMKRLYPSTDFRSMGDGDILIRLEQYEKIKGIMKDVGCEFRCESAHEFVYNKNGVCIELHKTLIPPYNKDYHSYYGDGWKLAVSDVGTRYKLSDNDHYVYMFTHFAKHYRDGGVGIMHMVDFWVYERSKELNFDYICEELRKLQLLDFFNSIHSTIDVWFNGANETDVTGFITSRVLQNGVWGNSESKALASAVKTSKSSSVKGITFKKAMRIMFPRVDEMKFRYPVLKKKPILLPVCWVHRFFNTVLFKRDRLKSRIEEVKHSKKDKVIAYQDELHYVGLDFNFKE